MTQQDLRNLQNVIRIVEGLMALSFLNKIFLNGQFENEMFNIIISGMEETPEKNKTTSVLKWKHFPNWSKLIYHVAALLKIKNWLLWKRGKMDRIVFKSFTLHDLKQAVKEISKQAQ